MKILVAFKSGHSDILEVNKIDVFSKNPCEKCRPQNSCYDHGCFTPEDWGNFLDLGTGKTIRIQDVANIKVVSF